MTTIVKPFRIPSGARPDISTAEGIIPAVAVDVASGSFWLVPQVQKFKMDGKGRAYPERDGKGRVVYAVPGGGSYVQPK